MLQRLFLNERFILGLILANSAILFYGGYAQGSEKHILTVADHLITGLFIVELLVKFRAFGLRRYFGSGWNKLDFILVVLSLPALLMFVFRVELFDFSFLLVFRILRVFKAFRFFRFIPDIHKLTAGVQRAMKASLYVFAGFVIYIFIIGILTYYLFQGTGSAYFADPMISLYSIFKIFTVEGWAEIPESITATFSATVAFFTYVYFIFVVLTGGIFGLSLVNSIFVDSMMSDNNDELEEKIDRLEGMMIKMLEQINQYQHLEKKIVESKELEKNPIIPSNKTLP